MPVSNFLKGFESREETQWVDILLKEIYSPEWKADYSIDDLKTDVEELKTRTVFLEGIADYFGNCDASQTKEMLEEVERRYHKTDIPIPKAVKLWFQKEGRIPGINRGDRKNLYDFCIAMGMDYVETAEFFMKSFLTIPFNYKDRVDAIYCYCLKMKRPYSIIQRMIEETENFEATNPIVESTKYVGEQIFSIESDEEFMTYLKTYCFDRQHQYATTRKYIIELAEENKKISRKKETSAEYGITSRMRLMESILGVRYQGLSKKQKARGSHNNLPGFPRDSDINNILPAEKEEDVPKKEEQFEKVTSETLRKTLILMCFYNYYQSQIKETPEKYFHQDIVAELLDDFIKETNEKLSECGFVQLYPRNPYDWIILYCANSINPIDCLKEFYETYYWGGDDDEE